MITHFATSSHLISKASTTPQASGSTFTSYLSSCEIVFAGRVTISSQFIKATTTSKGYDVTLTQKYPQPFV
ncbi:hypothetical protein AB1N83_010879 [Pleurotus pulmonarius]